MWDVKACRGCLTVKGKLEKVGEVFKRVYSALTDLAIVEGDGYPNYFCLECRTQIKKCMAFRRKSRRAHFVLKEIMSVRKQVTYSDIITVNRKKTNLESSLNFWDPQKSGYVALKVDCEDEESSEKDKTSKKVFQNTRTRILDIEPDIKETKIENDDFPEDTVLDIPDFKDMINDNDKATDDFNDAQEPEAEDFDLNDVFKGLNDDKSDTETMVNEPVKKKQTDDILEKMVKSHKTSTVLDALEKFTIKVLNLEEQKDKFAFRVANPAFALALYKCSMCLSTYSDMPQLVQHVEFHNSRRDGQECEVCKSKFLTVEDLNKHISQWHMYEYTCNECTNISYTLFDAVKHNKQNHGAAEKMLNERRKAIANALETFTVCPLTESVMDKIKTLREEMGADNQSDEDKLKCGVCDLSFSKLQHLKQHITMRHKNMYTCKECQEVCTDRKSAVAHANGHKENPTSFLCEHCAMKFSSRPKLTMHRCSAQKDYACNVCGAGLRTLRSYYKHQLLKHKYLSLNDPLVGDPQHKCADCGVQFLDKKAYEKHVVVANHSGAQDVEFSCVPCKKIFEDEEQMETHFITCVRNKKYPRKCCYCEEVLKDHIEYQRHYLYQHPTLQYRYTKMNTICELCGRLVPKNKLEAHLKTHQISAYECRHCGVASGTATAHVLHVLSAHAAQPFCCSLCRRRFRHRADCKDHVLKVHAPTKLYKCQFCELEFSYFKHLRNHSASKHNLIIPNMKGNPKKAKDKVYVYAHMYIEINEAERDAVEKAEVAMLDYLDQKSKPVDYKDFFKLSENPDEYIVRIHKKLRKKKKPRTKVKIESDILIAPSELEEAVSHISEVKDEVKMEPVMDIEIKYQDEFETVKDETVQEIETVMETEKEEVAMETDLGLEALEHGKPLEVFENDGSQYVMIGGQLYRIAGDSEEE